MVGNIVMCGFRIIIMVDFSTLYSYFQGPIQDIEDSIEPESVFILSSYFFPYHGYLLSGSEAKSGLDADCSTQTISRCMI